jgi:hypothetical protein
MRTRYVLLLVAGAAALAAVVPGGARGQDGGTNRDASRPQGRTPTVTTGGVLGILAHGQWQCALPGDAGGAAFVEVPEEAFLISTASSYRTADGGRGIYLMRGTEVVFTRGPKKDQRFRVRGENTLQKLNPDGSASKLICTRVGQTTRPSG